MECTLSQLTQQHLGLLPVSERTFEESVDLILVKSTHCRMSFRKTPVCICIHPSVAKGGMIKNVNACTLVSAWDERVCFALRNIYFSLQLFKGLLVLFYWRSSGEFRRLKKYVAKLHLLLITWNVGYKMNDKTTLIMNTFSLLLSYKCYMVKLHLKHFCQSAISSKLFH